MRLENGADVEVLAEGGLDADLDVVEVDEDGDVEAVLMRQIRSLCVEAVAAVRCEAGLDAAAAGSVQPVLRSASTSEQRRCDVRRYCYGSASGAGRLGRRPDDARELTALQQLAALAAAAGHFVLGRADGLLGAAGRFDRQQVAVAGRGDEPSTRSSSRELDQDDALARARQVVHLVGPAEQPARLRPWRRSAPRSPVSFATPTTSAPFAGRAKRRPGARARLDERLEAEPQRVAVARDGDGVDRRRRRPVRACLAPAA